MIYPNTLPSSPTLTPLLSHFLSTLLLSRPLLTSPLLTPPLFFLFIPFIPYFSSSFLYPFSSPLCLSQFFSSPVLPFSCSCVQYLCVCEYRMTNLVLPLSIAIMCVCVCAYLPVCVCVYRTQPALQAGGRDNSGPVAKHT